MSLRGARFCVCLFLIATSSVWAQFRGAIQGTVQDNSGAAIPNAKVTLTNKETQRKLSTTTSAEGFYRFNGLAPASYSVEVSANGMRTGIVEGVSLAAEATTGIDIVLQPGAITETVTVTSAVTPALETETANIATELNGAAVNTLPQVGRDPYELLRLAPGVFGDNARSGTGGSVALPNATGPGGSNTSIFQTENQIAIVANGQRTSQNNFQIDGVSANSLTWGGAAIVTPSLESVKSMRVAS